MRTLRTFSFTDDETELLNHIDSQDNKSQYIKSLIKKDLRSDTENQVKYYVLKYLKLFGINVPDKK